MTPTEGQTTTGVAEIVEAMGARPWETAQIAAKCGVTTRKAWQLLKRAEAEGKAESRLANGRYWRQGAARPLIWKVTTGAKTP